MSIVLDLDRVRIDIGGPVLIEEDTWYGGKFTKEISKIKDGWQSKDLGGKLFLIETGIGNWLADVVDGYHPAHILEFNEKKQKYVFQRK